MLLNTTPAKKTALAAVLCALAICLALVENALPLMLVIPLPGIRLGLANLVTVFALYYLGFTPALTVLVLRCVLTAVLSGTVSALAFSLCGGLLALIAMALLMRVRVFSVWGVSVGGAAMHNVGQIIAAIFVLGGTQPLFYLPWLLIAGAVCGAFTGLVSTLLFRALESTVMKKYR